MYHSPCGGIGRLQIKDPDILVPLLQQAQVLASHLNTGEVSTILWAMSRIKSTEFKTVFHLTRRFADSTGDLRGIDASPQEAASILFALGRLDIRDEVIFRNLSGVLMDQINETTAQSVASVLWAHRAVHIAPPQELMDRWASARLGLEMPVLDDPPS